MYALNVASIPQNLNRLRTDAGRARGSESNVDAPLLDHRCRRSSRIEWMHKLRLRDIEQFPIADDLPRVTVNAQHKQFPAVFARGSQPNLLPIDYGRRPAPIVNRGFPDDIPRLAPMQRQAMCVRMPVAVRSAKLRPVLSSAHRRIRRQQK